MPALASPETLATSLRGRVLLPEDAGFERAATAWNLAVEQRVAAVVEVADAEDVATTVSHARRSGLSVAAQSTGHGASGQATGTILLRTGRLDDVQVDPGRGVARVGAGARWGAVQSAAAPHGLSALLGSAPGVGAVGYTLGGGLGWLSRRHGLASDHVRSFDVVDADGRPATVTATSDPELFWALRGGGGDLAVVTSMEIDLVPVPAFAGGALIWSADRHGDALDAFRTVTATAPPELSVWLTRVEPPHAPAMVVVHTAFLGEAAMARELLQPFAAIPDTIGPSIAAAVRPVGLADIGQITSDPTAPTAGRSRALLLSGIADPAIDRLFAGLIAPLMVVQLRHLGGALATAPQGAGALGAISEPYLASGLGLAADRRVASAVGDRLDQLAAELATVATGRKPTTFLAPGEHASAAFAPGALARLRQLKSSRDPEGVVRGAYPLHG